MIQSEQSNQKIRICKVCFKDIKEATFHNLFHKDVTICHNCFLELKPTLEEFKINDIKCLALYPYDEKIQELIYQYKGCNDYELRSVFLEYYKEYLQVRYHNYVMVPAPSSTEAYLKRGFHHVEEIYGFLGLKCIQCVHKSSDVKQHNLKSKDREKIKDSLYIDNVDFTNKKVLIVDDIYTTGSTAKSMIDLIKTKNPKKIALLVVAKTIFNPNKAKIQKPKIE